MARKTHRTRPNRFVIAGIVIFLPTIALSALPCACSPRVKDPGPEAGPAVALVNQKGKQWTVKVETARTLAEKAKGLMWRWSLPSDQGMLFIYEQARPRRFWMKNTRIPLDIIFIDENRKIACIVERAQPYSEEKLTCEKPAQWVLEVNAGEAEKHGLSPGDRVYFFNLGENHDRGT